MRQITLLVFLAVTPLTNILAQDSLPVTASQTPHAIDRNRTIPPLVDRGHALLRVPDPQSQAWLLLAQGTRSSHADSLAGPPPSPISDQGKGWIILGILVVVVLGIVFVPKAYE